MKVLNVKEGAAVIPYKVTKTKISFNDDELAIDVARFQKDDEVTKDIMIDSEGYLTTGHGSYYAAQVIIPAREYDEEEVEDDSETATPAEGEEKATKIIKTPKALDMAKVTLKLFPVDGIVIL